MMMQIALPISFATLKEHIGCLVNVWNGDPGDVSEFSLKSSSIYVLAI
jgi:hypothetical protein